MTFSVIIETDGGDAFIPNPELETARILRKLADKLRTGEIRFNDHRHGAREGKLLDGNGNTTGSWLVR